jgi:hypothetical protein
MHNFRQSKLRKLVMRKKIMRCHPQVKASRWTCHDWLDALVNHKDEKMACWRGDWGRFSGEFVRTILSQGEGI